MPVAKLSREFYERFGDKLTDELVNCLNAIEGSYRAELRDLFDAHFGRFEEKLERRLADARQIQGWAIFTCPFRWFSWPVAPSHGCKRSWTLERRTPGFPGTSWKVLVSCRRRNGRSCWRTDGRYTTRWRGSASECAIACNRRSSSSASQAPSPSSAW